MRTNLKENTSRLLITLKIQVDGQDDGQDDKNNEHNGMKNVRFFYLTFVASGPHCHEMKC